MPPELTENEFLVLLNDHGNAEQSFDWSLGLVRNYTRKRLPDREVCFRVWEKWIAIQAPEKLPSWEDQLREITEFYSNHIVDGKVNGFHSAFGMITHLYADLQAAGLLKLPVDLTSLSRD